MKQTIEYRATKSLSATAIHGSSMTVKSSIVEAAVISVTARPHGAPNSADCPDRLRCDTWRGIVASYE